MLDSLFVAGAVAAVGEALVSAHAGEGSVAVIGNARLANALAKQRTTLAVGLSARAAKKIAGAVDDLRGVEAHSLAASCATVARSCSSIAAVRRRRAVARCAAGSRSSSSAARAA
jgi:hypothetical protein